MVVKETLVIPLNENKYERDREREREMKRERGERSQNKLSNFEISIRERDICI